MQKKQLYYIMTHRRPGKPPEMHLILASDLQAAKRRGALMVGVELNDVTAVSARSLEASKPGWAR